jgi:hypothetical protein
MYITYIFLIIYYYIIGSPYPLLEGTRPVMKWERVGRSGILKPCTGRSVGLHRHVGFYVLYAGCHQYGSHECNLRISVHTSVVPRKKLEAAIGLHFPYE